MLLKDHSYVGRVKRSTLFLYQQTFFVLPLYPRLSAPFATTRTVRTVWFNLIRGYVIDVLTFSSVRHPSTSQTTTTATQTYKHTKCFNCEYFLVKNGDMISGFAMWNYRSFQVYSDIYHQLSLDLKIMAMHRKQTVFRLEVMVVVCGFTQCSLFGLFGGFGFKYCRHF